MHEWRIGLYRGRFRRRTPHIAVRISGQRVSNVALRLWRALAIAARVFRARDAQSGGVLPRSLHPACVHVVSSLAHSESECPAAPHFLRTCGTGPMSVSVTPRIVYVICRRDRLARFGATVTHSLHKPSGIKRSVRIGVEIAIEGRNQITPAAILGGFAAAAEAPGAEAPGAAEAGSTRAAAHECLNPCHVPNPGGRT
jgi:hypothetical protein